MRLVLIRHGEDYNSILPYDPATQRWVGRTVDPSLTSDGRAQAMALGDWLTNQSAAGETIHCAFVSPMRRALGTASHSLGPNIPIDVHPDLHEVGGAWNYIGEADPEEAIKGGPVGMYPGLSQDDVKRVYPRFGFADAVWPKGGWWNGRPFERVDQSFVRAGKFLTFLSYDVACKPFDTVVVISHQKFINRLIARLVGVPWDHFWVPIDHCGVTTFNMGPCPMPGQVRYSRPGYGFVLEGMNMKPWKEEGAHGMAE